MALNMFCRVAELISDEFVGQIGETIKRDASHSSTRELDASAMRRNFPNSSVEAMTSHRIQSPMHRPSFVGLNMICDKNGPKREIKVTLNLAGRFLFLKIIAILLTNSEFLRSPDY